MKAYLILFLSLALSLNAYSQNDGPSKRLRLGLNYGQASQNKFPLDNPNYAYSNQYLKFQINFSSVKDKKLSYEFNIEPSLYLSEHQLLNENFIQPDDNPDYLNQRALFTKERSFQEYVVNFGIILRYKITHEFSSYLLGSIGPMWATAETERLKKGFAFSDILGLGFSYQINKVVLDLRTTLRHNSNANLSKPNHGHNSVGIETGISFFLR